MPICTVLIKVAALAEAMGDYHGMVLLLAFADKNAGDLISTLPTYKQEQQQLVTVARTSIGEKEFNKFWTEGEGLNLDAAVALAMHLPVD